MLLKCSFLCNKVLKILCHAVKHWHMYVHHISTVIHSGSSKTTQYSYFFCRWCNAIIITDSLQVLHPTHSVISPTFFKHVETLYHKKSHLSLLCQNVKIYAVQEKPIRNPLGYQAPGNWIIHPDETRWEIFEKEYIMCVTL